MTAKVVTVLQQNVSTMAYVRHGFDPF